MRVVFEGHDGVGKSSIIKVVQEYFTEIGWVVCCLKNPSTIFEKMRRSVDSSDNLVLSFRFYLMSSLFVETQAELLETKNDLILIDRSIFSTIVSHTARGYPIPVGIEYFSSPDLKFWIRVDEDLRRKRILDRSCGEVTGHDAKTFSDKIIKQANDLYDRFDMIKIDNSRELRVATNEVINIIKSKSK